MRSARVVEGAAARPPHSTPGGGGAPFQTSPKRTPPRKERRKERSKPALMRQAEWTLLGVEGRPCPWGVCELHRAAALPPLVNTPLTTTLKQTRHLNTNLTKNLQS